MRQQESRLDELDIRVKVVTFDGDVMAENYARNTKLPWPLLKDKSRDLYKTYGMSRGSWWAIYGPVSIWKYLKLMASGQQPGKPGSDWRQLGGDVLIDPEGIVRLHHISQAPHDRPAIADVLEIVASAKPQ